jgi:GxxExxY protein
MDYKYGDTTEKILRAAMNVHTALGNGFQEVVYQRAPAVELGLMNIVFGREISCLFFIRTCRLEKDGLIF